MRGGGRGGGGRQRGEVMKTSTLDLEVAGSRPATLFSLVFKFYFALPLESLFPRKASCDRVALPNISIMTSLVYAVLFVCDRTNTRQWGLTLLRQMDMGSLTCAHLCVRAGYTRTGVSYKQVCV